jgi:hypothetical protein
MGPNTNVSPDVENLFSEMNEQPCCAQVRITIDEAMPK